MSSTNPFLGMSVYSLMNALELYQKNEERHRFGAIILMDLSVEYIMKAKLYQLNPAEFMGGQQELGFADLMKKDEKIGFVGDEKTYLSRVHIVRNFAQHRGSIPDSLVTQEYMQWLSQFINRFSSENFKLNILTKLPLEHKRTWIKLSVGEKTTQSKPFNLERPLDEYYKSAKTWISLREKNSKKGLKKSYKNSLLFALRKYSEFLKKNPDEIVEEALLSSPDETFREFADTVGRNVMPYSVALKSFYRANEIIVQLRCPHYYPTYSTEGIATEQLRKICDAAKLETKSWILANSYMGLKVGRVAMLKVEDFHRASWSLQKPIYPVKIRPELSNYFDYTTFIGADAKQVLEKYFNERNFNPDDQPWKTDNSSNLSRDFRECATKAHLYGSGSQYKFSAKSLTIRLESKLEDSGMRHEWICDILGLKPHKGMAINRPLDSEIAEADEKAFPKLRVYDT
jgi:hypothetical protein